MELNLVHPVILGRVDSEWGQGHQGRAKAGCPVEPEPSANLKAVAHPRAVCGHADLLRGHVVGGPFDDGRINAYPACLASGVGLRQCQEREDGGQGKCDVSGLFHVPSYLLLSVE